MGAPTTYICPFCGSEVRVGRPCPGCKPSAPKRRSWEQDPGADGLDLPEKDFDYDEFVAREFGGAPHKSLRVKWYWWLLGVVLIIAMAMFAFGLF